MLDGRQLLLVVLAIACRPTGAADDAREWTTVDSWHTGAPSTKEGWADIPPERYVEVSEAQLVAAKAMLEDRSVAELPAAALSALALELEPVAGLRPYLLRGVLLNAQTGGYWLHVLGDQAWVHHGSLGHTPVPMQRHPLVALLATAPARVWLTCSLAQ